MRSSRRDCPSTALRSPQMSSRPIMSESHPRQHQLFAARRYDLPMSSGSTELHLTGINEFAEERTRARYRMYHHNTSVKHISSFPLLEAPHNGHRISAYSLRHAGLLDSHPPSCSLWNSAHSSLSCALTRPCHRRPCSQGATKDVTAPV